MGDLEPTGTLGMCELDTDYRESNPFHLSLVSVSFIILCREPDLQCLSIRYRAPAFDLIQTAMWQCDLHQDQVFSPP